MYYVINRIVCAIRSLLHHCFPKRQIAGLDQMNADQLIELLEHRSFISRHPRIFATLLAVGMVAGIMAIFALVLPEPKMGWYHSDRPPVIGGMNVVTTVRPVPQAVQVVPRHIHIITTSGH